MKMLLTYRNMIVALVTILLTLTLHGVSPAQTYSHIYVDAVNGVNAPTDRGSAAQPYKSITFALAVSERNQLPDPWHVHIRPGTYDADPTKPANEREIFPLKLRDGMIFEGTTTAEGCIIDAQHVGKTQVPILLGITPDDLNLDTDGVTIRNLTLQNMERTDPGNSDRSPPAGGIVLQDPTVPHQTHDTPSKIEDCIIHNNGMHGVWSNTPLILTGNTFSSNGGLGAHTTKLLRVKQNTFSGNGFGSFSVDGSLSGDISENVFRGNRGNNSFWYNMDGNITGNTFEGNQQGVRIGTMTGDITHNTFENNNTSWNGNGGGFSISTITGNITHNTFKNNTVTGHGLGAGFYIHHAITGDITHNTFENNTSTEGGGFSIGTITGNITHNTFGNNTAHERGGAFSLRGQDGNVEVVNNIFFNNSTSQELAGDAVSTACPTIFKNNLFMTLLPPEAVTTVLPEDIGRSTTIQLSSPDCRFYNNIFVGMEIAIYTTAVFDLPITHNLFHGIKRDIVNSAGSGSGNDVFFYDLVAGNASDNLTDDPRLVDPAARDFHLQAASPAIDAGTNEFAPPDDFDGVVRPVGTTVDIGPYEYSRTPILVPPVDGGELIVDDPPSEPTTDPLAAEEATAAYPAWDVNEDGKTDIADLVLVATALGDDSPENPRTDVNGDGTVNIQDLILVATHLGEEAGPAAPVLVALSERLTPDTLQQVLDLLRSQDEGSVAFQRAMANVEQLLASLTPKETALLPNYPNPFNPETWIPYQLASPADVALHIHAVDSTLIRTLSLGHKGAGIYQTRNRAAYWDGRNEGGEPVASGVYFYTLTIGDFTATRKMLIRK